MSEAAPPPADADAVAAEKLVPVAESIKHRRRAQQAEKRAEQLEQQLRDSQTQIESHLERLATAEAQRDELTERLAGVQQRHRIERMLIECGAVDVEAACLLLDKQGGLGPDADEPAVQAAVEKLLTDRPHLCGRGAALPEPTATGRARPAVGAKLVEAAQQAARSGDRRDIAKYLRLRRQLAAN